MKVEVKIGARHLPCTIVSNGVCKHCGDLIVWATMPNGKFIPLTREEAEDGIMESHFPYCVPHRRTSQRSGGCPGQLLESAARLPQPHRPRPPAMN